jgi:hypothetical protein
MFKRKQNESPYDQIVTVTETVFTKRTLALEPLVMKCHNELHENSTVGLVADVCDKQTDDWVQSACNIYRLEGT